MSVGQTQLFALARALVKSEILRGEGRRPVVLVDEGAGSLDGGGEGFVGGVMGREFEGCTVVGVAHRQGGGDGGGGGMVVEMEGGRLTGM